MASLHIVPDPTPSELHDLAEEVERINAELDRPVTVDSQNARQRRDILRAQRSRLLDRMIALHERDVLDELAP